MIQFNAITFKNKYVVKLLFPPYIRYKIQNTYTMTVWKWKKGGVCI